MTGNTITGKTRQSVVWLVFLSMPGWGVAQESVNLHEALLLDKVEVTARGAGIETVTGTVRRTPGTGPLVIRIPAGTLFVPDSSAVQNMVAVEESTIDLTTRDSADFVVRVACANRRLAIPSPANIFRVEPTPRPGDLSSVLPTLAEMKAPPALAQAVVWVVTDDATYGELGVLVRSSSLISQGSGSRIINESVAARAMMVIERAGLDLTSTRIWRDRQRVCMCVGTSDPDVTAWCQRLVPAPSESSSLEVNVSPDDRSYPRSSEFQIAFPISGAQGGRPDLTIDYAFYQQLPKGEKLFNRTAPQRLNAETLPADFCTGLGHKLGGGVAVPLTSFPEGNYRLEIKVTDRASGQTVTRSVNFTVLPE